MISVSVMTGVGGQAGTVPLHISKFPCGESKVEFYYHSLPLDIFYEQVTVRLDYQSDQDLIDLLLVVDAIKRSPLGYKRMALLVAYFPYGRQDRVCNPGEPHSLKVVCQLINSCRFDVVYVIDPHSDVIEALLDNPDILDIASIVDASDSDVFKKCTHLVSPDGGAYKKVTKAAQMCSKPVIRADKIRDTRTGQLSGFEVYAEDLTGLSVLIVDDICDGGGTFIGLTKKLREKGAESVSLYVTHGMFTKGVDLLLSEIDEISCCYYNGPEDDRSKVKEISLYG